MGIFTGGVSAGTIYANLRLKSTLDKDVKGANKRLDSIATKFAMVGVVGAGAAVAITAKFVKMAAAEEVVSRRTSALLKAQGIMWEDVSESLDVYLKDLERLTAYNDTDLQESFNTLLVSGMSYAEAMDSMNTVTSMSYSLNRDLVSMAMLVGKAYNGQTGELSRYGIVLDQTLDQTQKFEALQGYVNDNFADASERTGTLEGQMDVLENSMFNIAESMGAELLPGLIENLEALNEWGDEGGWKATADALKTIAGLMENIATSAGWMMDAVNILQDGMALWEGEKDSPEYQAAWMRARFGQDYEEVEVPTGFGGPAFGMGERGALLPTTAPAPSPTPTAVGGRGGPIPGWAGKGYEFAPDVGAPTVYTGAPTAAAGAATAGTSAVSMLMSIDAGIVESNRLSEGIISAVQNIRISIGMGGGFGARGGSEQLTADPREVRTQSRSEAYRDLAHIVPGRL